MLPQKTVFALEKELYCYTHTPLSHDFLLHLTYVTLEEEFQPQDFSHNMMRSAMTSCVVEGILHIHFSHAFMVFGDLTELLVDSLYFKSSHRKLCWNSLSFSRVLHITHTHTVSSTLDVRKQEQREIFSTN